MIYLIIKRGFQYFIQQSGACFSQSLSFFVSSFTLSLLSAPYNTMYSLPIFAIFIAFFLIHAFSYTHHFLQEDLDNGTLIYARLGGHSDLSLIIGYTLSYFLWMLIPLLGTAIIISLLFFPLNIAAFFLLPLGLFIFLIAKIIALISCLSAPLKKNSFLSILWGMPLCLPGIFFLMTSYELILMRQSPMNMILLLCALNIFYDVLLFIIGPIALRYAINNRF